MTEDGGIFVSLDDGEVGRFRLVADEIFGTRNFVSQCVWHKKYTRANDATHFSDNHDHVVMYAKDKSRLIIHRLERTEKQDRAYSNPNKHPKGPWKPTPLHAKSGEDEFFTYTFSNGVKWSPPEGTFPRFSPHTLKKLDDANEIWFGGEGGAVPQRMSFLSEVSDGLVPVTLWPYSEVGHNHEANDELKEIGLSGRFQNPKPIRLVERCLELMCNNDDVIMDCFAGSGTTGHAALKFSKRTESNIRFILVETIASVATTITSERLARAISGYQASISSKQRLWEKTLTLRDLKTGEALLKTIDDVIARNRNEYEEVKIDFNDGKIIIFGETKSAQFREGLGSGFRFCTLGEPLFDADGNVSPAVVYPDLAAHVFFCDTGSPIPQRADGSSALIGTFQGRAIYLLFASASMGFPSAKAGNVLTAAMLDALPLPEPGFNGPRVVYAEGCTVPDDRLAAAGVTFRQLPYQIEGL